MSSSKLTRIRIAVVAVAVGLLLTSFQNCAVQQSEDRQMLNQTLLRSGNTTTDCLPYLSTNQAMIAFETTSGLSAKQISGAATEFICLISVNVDNLAGLNSMRCTISPEIKTAFDAVGIVQPTNGACDPGQDISAWTFPAGASTTQKGPFCFTDSKGKSATGLWYEQDIPTGSSSPTSKLVIGLAKPIGGNEAVQCQFAFTNSSEWADTSVWNSKVTTAQNRLQQILQFMVASPVGVW